MKLTEIRIDRTKNLGSYENIKLGFTAVIDELENPVDAVERIKNLLDWEINREERDAQYTKFKAQLDSGALNGDTAKVEAWVAKYEERKNQVAAISE